MIFGGEQRVRFNDGSVPSTRLSPITHTLITGTSSGAANTIYAVRAGISAKVERLTVVNTSGSAVALTLHAVPDAGSIATGNTELGGVSIPANTAADLTDFIGGFYGPGTTLRAFAGTGSVLVMHGWVEEIL
jgi:hypothetical protein